MATLRIPFASSFKSTTAATLRRGAPLLGVVLIAGSTIGCVANHRSIQDRDALYVQNQELQKELDRTRAALDQSESARSDLQNQVGDLKTQLAAKPAPGIAPAPSAPQANGFTGISGVETFQGNGFITVRVPGDVLFAPGKVDLRATSKKTLSEIADVIKSKYADDTVRIEGYTDKDPIKKSKWKDNLDLSLERAAAVQRYLQTQGVKGDHLYSAGFGSTHPESTKAKSRRVEIVVVQK